MNDCIFLINGATKVKNVANLSGNIFPAFTFKDLDVKADFQIHFHPSDE